MGTWSHEIFGNDSACDWAADLASVDSLRPIEAAIGAVARASEDGVDADAAAEALAAAEAIARLRGHPGERSAYSEALDDWVLRTRLQPPPTLVRDALAAVERIGSPGSELHESWSEGDEGAAWLATLADLRSRLGRPPREPVAPPPGDALQRLLRRVLALRFDTPSLPDDARVGAWYQQALRGAAVGDTASVHDAIERLWQPVAQLDKPSIAFDLAVRDAQALAMQGRLDEALDGLAAWRGAPAADAPGMFEMRASGVCQAGGDAQRTDAWRHEAIALAPEQAMWRLDASLFAARAGSAAAAQAQLDDIGNLGSEAALALVGHFIRGVLACRRGDPAALALLKPVAEDFVDKCQQGAAVWSLASAAIGWWALALAQAGRSDEARQVAHALRPVLLQPHNELLVNLLSEAGVLPANAGAPARPPRVGFDGPAMVDHGAFRSLALRGVNALKWVEAQRRRFAAGEKAYPFLIGDDEDLRRLLAMIAPPPTAGGRCSMRQLGSTPRRG
ncbi:MAG: DUF4259 domain-containing protein [Rubrivivax sp.]|nr:DUF4259 domain-containing protein [Rubrivivax sp.]